MSHQPSLFDPPAPPPRIRKRPIAATSHDAKMRNAPHASGQAERLYMDISTAGLHGRTRQELADRTGIKLQSVCPAVLSLLTAGRIYERQESASTGERRPVRRNGRTILIATTFAADDL